MAMLHPKFNHLGRSEKKPKKSKELTQARIHHVAFLRKMGIKPKDRFLRLIDPKMSKGEDPDAINLDKELG
jgi:hypothetical protein